jgi:hypothetical protein
MSRPRTKMHERLSRSYDRHLRSIGHVNGALSLTLFMCNLAAKDTGACYAVLEAGFLDVLLAVYFLELEIDTSHFDDHFNQEFIYPADDLTKWNSHLKVFTNTHGASKIFLNHTLQRFWPKTKWNSHHLSERRKAWKSLQNPHSAVTLRCAGLYRVISRSVLDKTSTSLDACADLLEFIWSACVSIPSASQLILEKLWQQLGSNRSKCLSATIGTSRDLHRQPALAGRHFA